MPTKRRAPAGAQRGIRRARPVRERIRRSPASLVAANVGIGWPRRNHGARGGGGVAAGGGLSREGAGAGPRPGGAFLRVRRRGGPGTTRGGAGWSLGAFGAPPGGPRAHSFFAPRAAAGRGREPLARVSCDGARPRIAPRRKGTPRAQD